MPHEVALESQLPIIKHEKKQEQRRAPDAFLERYPKDVQSFFSQSKNPFDYLRNLKKEGKIDAWASELGTRQIHLMQMMSYAAKRLQKNGKAFTLDNLVSDEAEQETKRLANEPDRKKAELRPKINLDQMRSLDKLLSADLGKAEFFIQQTGVPEEMKTFFELQVDLARRFIDSGDMRALLHEVMVREERLEELRGKVWSFKMTDDELKEFKTLKEKEPSAEEKMAVRRLDAMVFYLEPILDTLSLALTEQLRAEYAEKYLKPTVQALRRLFPDLDQAALVERVKTVDVEVVSPIGKMDLPWDQVTGRYNEETRRISVSLAALADREGLDHVLSHETLHALSDRESENRTIVQAAEGIPLIPAPEKGFFEGVFTPEEWKRANIALTEAITESLNRLLLAERGFAGAPKSYQDECQVLQQSLAALKERGLDFSMRDVARIYFSAEKDLSAAWPRAIKDDQPGGLLHLMTRLKATFV